MTRNGPPGIEIDALETFLRAHRPGMFDGRLAVTLISGGRSNLTYLVTDGRRKWVLRRPPLGHVLETAHDMSREYRVLEALADTDVPVPRPRVIAGPEPLGAPFYVMDFTEGTVLRERGDLDDFGTSPRDLAHNLADTLARLHLLDPAAVGLGELGRPQGFLERQVRRWQRQLLASHSRDLPELSALGERLARELPIQQPPAIVHGDYRLDNVMVDPASGRIVGVLDWEMATLGDPLTDVASMALWWDGIRGLNSPVAAVPGDVPGFPDSDVLIERYFERVGREPADLSWYLGFAYYKIAAIFEGIHYRSQQGLTVGAGFEGLGVMVPALVERGHAALVA
ncbi:phosphotransferase family protein [Nocardia callitridis]|uniref:Phosphotransferase family protein n=1 Tax=Nocardia callitridis TaxID=648753 RepID=A0ABP9KL06_9NOCA